MYSNLQKFLLGKRPPPLYGQDSQMGHIQSKVLLY